MKTITVFAAVAADPVRVISTLKMQGFEPVDQ
jgi:hypothetical protein